MSNSRVDTIKLSQEDIQIIEEKIEKNPRAAVEFMFEKIGLTDKDIRGWSIGQLFTVAAPLVSGWNPRTSQEKEGFLLVASGSTQDIAYAEYARKILSLFTVEDTYFGASNRLQICLKDKPEGRGHAHRHVVLQRPQAQVVESMQAVA